MALKFFKYKNLRHIGQNQTFRHSKLMTTSINHEENQYLALVRDCIERGYKTEDRTGTGTLALFGASMRFNLQNHSFPLLTTKQTAFKSILAEMLFFIRGETDNRKLTQQNVNIWTRNSTRAYFDKVGISRAEGDLGPVYGFQWRHFGADYTDCSSDYSGKGIDQLKNIVDELKKGSFSRRLVVTAWNPTQLKEMALPPCHCLFQFQRQGDRLNCSLYQRSADMGLGVPFNIASYSLMTIVVAKLSGLKPGEFVHFLGDYHVYLDHVDALKTQLQRKPYAFPALHLREKNYLRLEDFEAEDFELVGYKFNEKIQMKMSV